MTRPRGLCIRQMLAAGHALQIEGLQKCLWTVGTRQPVVLRSRVSQVETHATVALREGQEVHIVLGADHLRVGRPAVCSVDQHAGKQMMRRVAVQRDIHLAAHLRATAVGTDDQPAMHAPFCVVVVNSPTWLISRRFGV